MLVPPVDLSYIDFEQGEKIELTGNIGTEQYSSLQYFSTRAEFKDRFSALMGWAGKTSAKVIYGTIAVKQNVFYAQSSSVDSTEDAITQFQDIFIRSIRVPRKYTPPVANESKKRKSDHPDYRDARGNFDLACRTPSGGDDPHMLEFVLYGCTYDDALRKIKTFKGFARDLGLSIEIKIFDYTSQNVCTKKTKTRSLLRIPMRWIN